MNINQLLFNTAYNELLSIMPYGLSKDDLKKYFVNDIKKPKSLEEVYRQFIKTASENYSHTASIIKFDENQTKISELLKDYNYEYVSLLSDAERVKLSEKFRDLFIIQRECENEREKLLKRWFSVVLGSALFISGCQSIDGFNNRVNRTYDPKQVPIRISNEIEGFGFKSACDVLTNLGYYEYVRPNYHLFEICTRLEISEKGDYAAFDAMRRIASDNNITPFELDRIIQLVCSGDFYKDNKRVNARGNRERIIQSVKSRIDELDTPLTEVEENEKQRIAVKSLINAFDSLDMTETIPDNLNDALETSMNEEDITCIKEMCKSNRNDLLIKLLRPFASENSDVALVETEGYISRVETLDDKRIKITFTITNDNMHKFNLLYLYSNFMKHKDSDYYIPLTFKEKAKLGYHLIDDLYYPFEYYYECIVSEEEANKREWLRKTEETKYYKLEVKDYGSSFEEFNAKSKRTGRIIFYDEENVHGGKLNHVKEIQKPNSCIGQIIKSDGTASEYFNVLFKSYKESKINIYRVGQGNCITLLISYANALKKSRLLVFDAGTNKGKSFIDSNAALLKNSIQKSKPHEVYFLLSHYHKDHRNIMHSLFEMLKTDGTNQKSNMFCVLPCKGSNSDFDPEKLYSMGIFRERARIIDGDADKKLFDNNNIKVFQGKACSEIEWEDINSQSIMIQLKNTLLPADSYFRYWPDEYGQICISGKRQYKKFSYIIAPHHGYTASNTDVDRDRFISVCSINDRNTRLYITRNDVGHNGSNEITEILKDLSIPGGTDHSHVEVTYTPDNKRANPITFTDS